MTFRSAALGIALAAALCSTAVIAVAQIAPSDPGLGVKLGMEQQNNSGEVGTVTLFARGANTLVDVRCFNTAGAPVDTYFSLSYHYNTITESMGGLPGIPQQGGFAWAHDALSASYTPSTT